MLDQLINALVESRNEAADEVFLEALRLGSKREKDFALRALLARQSVCGLRGVIAYYNNLPEPLQTTILKNIRLFHAALRECGRGQDPLAAITTMKLIAVGRQGRLTYVLSEALHGTQEEVSRAAAEAMVALARWAAVEARRLQQADSPSSGADPLLLTGITDPRAAVYRQLMQERPEIEQAVARALDVHRGRHGQELLRAALLLADWPGSKTLAILQTAKHGGQTAMVRRLQQVPDSEHVEAFLLAASHAALRTQFGVVFSHISEPPVLDALLRRTHWLKDQQLQLCLRQVTRGIWWDQPTLEKDLARRDDADAARVAEWLAASGINDALQDDRLEQIRLHLHHDLPGRVRLLRIAMQRPRGASLSLLRSFLVDPDERFVRMAAREFARRKSPDYENLLLQLMNGAPQSVRQVIGRSVGQVGFEYFWQRFDRLDIAARKSAGRATLNLLTDGLQRLDRRLRIGPVEQRLKAIQIVQDVGVGEELADTLLVMCQDPNPKLRSKAVAVLAAVKAVPSDALLERVLNDADGRVRANAIEVLEAKQRVDFVPVLTERARSGHSRERANAIKAMHSMRVSTASTQLVNMLQDERPEHRISALWALQQIGFWQMLSEVGNLAKADPNTRVRRYALAVLRHVARLIRQSPGRAVG